VNWQPYQTVPVTCPQCGNRYVSPVLTIVDAGQDPEAKALLLSGQMNVAVCPQCGQTGMLNAPLVYHDPEQELLFTYVPGDLSLPEVERQRIIGDLSSRVMSALQPEQRKGYLLQPRNFLRLGSLVEAILEAEGITPEMLAAQRAKAELLNRLLQNSGQARQVIARENDQQIDEPFFQLLELNLALAMQAEQQAAAESLLQLRKELLQWTNYGQQVAAREEAIASLGERISREDLLDKLIEAALAGKQIQVETMVAVARPVIDYIFYQQLTDRAEAAQRTGDRPRAEQLKALRSRILSLTEEIDAELAQATEEASRFLEQVLSSDDPEKALQAHLDQVDELFLSVLSARMEAAHKAQRREEAEKLERVAQAMIRIIEESQPPEVQLVNELMTADYPEGTAQMLAEKRDQLTPTLLEIMQQISQDLAARGREEAATRLSQIREQAEALARATS
jgi:hypothetical protein